MSKYSKCSRWMDRYSRNSRLDNEVVDIASIRGTWIQKQVKGFVHEKKDADREQAELREAADGGKCDIFAMANSANTKFVESLAAIAEQLELGQTF